MDLNYDSFYLIKEQCKPPIFLLFTCRGYRGLIKEGKRYKVGYLELVCLSYHWLGMSNSIYNYIDSLLGNMKEDRYGITKNLLPFGVTAYMSNRIFLRVDETLF